MPHYVRCRLAWASHPTFLRETKNSCVLAGETSRRDPGHGVEQAGMQDLLQCLQVHYLYYRTAPRWTDPCKRRAILRIILYSKDIAGLLLATILCFNEIHNILQMKPQDEDQEQRGIQGDRGFQYLIERSSDNIERHSPTFPRPLMIPNED